MDRIDRSRWTVLAALAVTTVAVAAMVAPGAALAGATGGTASTDTMTSFQWEAPRNLTGPFAMSVRIDVTETTWCDYETTAYGTAQEDDPVAFWMLAAQDPGGSGGTALLLSRRAQAHVGSTVDTRTVTPGPRGDWAAGPGGGALVEDQMVLTIAAFDLGPVPSPDIDTPLSVEVACEDPFRIAGWHEGHQGRSFTQSSLQGGVGASADAGTGVGAVRVSRGDGLTETFDTARARLQVSPPLGGAFEGDLRLDHPNGTWSRHLESEEQPPQPRLVVEDFDAGPGRYGLRLDWAGMNRIWSFEPFGILVGMDPVDPDDRI